MEAQKNPELEKCHSDFLKICFELSALVLLVTIAGLTSSCTFKNNESGQVFAEKRDSILPPKVIRAENVVKIFLADRDPPKISVLSELPPPTEISAGFNANIQNFNTQDGLAMSSIICAYKDQSGCLWFGTSGNGASMYNGKSFTNFTSNHGLIHNFISAITQDSQGNVWFGTYGGVSKYDGFAFENFTVANGLPNNDVSVITEDRNGMIWLGTESGLCKYDPSRKKLEDYSQKPQGIEGAIYAILEDLKGQLWVSGENGLWKGNLSMAENEATVFIDFSGELVRENEEQGITFGALCEGKSGVIWLGSSGAIYSCSRKGVVKKHPLTGELASEQVNCLTKDRDGLIWVGTDRGIAKYDAEQGVFTNFTKANGLSHNRANSITEDNSGNLWFGTHGGGLDRYDGEAVMGYTIDQGLAGNAIYAISSDDKGNMWLAPSKSGLVKYTPSENVGCGGTFVNYTAEQQLLNTTVYASAKGLDGHLYFGGTNGLSKYTGKAFINFTEKQGLPDNHITGLFADKAGNIWAGTYEGGLSKFDGKSFSNYTTAQGLVHNTVWGICEDRQGRIWIATRGGLSIFDGQSFSNFKKPQGLPDNKLSSVMEDNDGNIIIGSWGGGLAIIKASKLKTLFEPGTNQDQRVFESFTTSEGLANDVVYQILQHEDSSIIIGTNVGFTVLQGGVSPETGKIIKNGIKYFNENAGYPIKDISNNYSMAQDDKGIIWAGTGDKLVRFDYGSIRESPDPPTVTIQQIKIGNEAVSWRSISRARMPDSPYKNNDDGTRPHITDELLTYNKKLSTGELNTLIEQYSDVAFDSISAFYAIPRNLELPFSKNTITFNFVGVETTRPKLVSYQYKLDGYEDKWNPVTKNSTATFGNIYEGSYTFLVKAQSPDGVWSAPLKYGFKILPPWYRSWYAYLFYILLFLAGLYLLAIIQRKRVLFNEHQKSMKLELDHAREIEAAFTDLKSTQTRLIHSEKMASLGELSAGVAHEIQNPLNFVANFSEVSSEMLEELKEELANGNLEDVTDILEDVQQNLGKIKHHGKRADAIVKGMLQHSRTQGGAMEKTDINALIDEFVQLAYHGMRAKDKSFDVGFETEYDQTVGRIKIIPQDIGRALLNLLTNAFYACGERSRTVRAKLAVLNEQGGQAIPGGEPAQNELESYSPKVWVRSKKHPHKLEISVKDNGNGIPKDELQKIFLPFYTTKPSGQGTGLGLGLSKDIVNAHGGELKVNTKKGSGTEFCIELPL